MAYTIEHQLVNKALEGGESLKIIRANGVKPSWFFDAQHADALKFVLEHYEKYGSEPSDVAFTAHMGSSYPLFEVTDSAQYLVDMVVRALRYDVLMRAVISSQDELKSSDPEAAAEVMRDALREIDGVAPTSSPLLDYADEDHVEQRWKEYEDRGKTGSSLLGYSTGFPTIDRATLGLQKGHLVTLVAQAKVGKTTLSLAVAGHVHKVHELKVLFATFEMSPRELSMRLDSIMSNVSLTRLQSGRLSPAEEARYDKYLDTVKAMPNELIFTDLATGGTVGALQALAENEKPDVIFIDGVYMMADEATGDRNTPQALTNITRSLKRMAVALDIPVFINTQALAWKSKGNKITANSIGYASSFHQDSDVVLGVEKVPLAPGEDEDAHATERVLKIMASRNSGLATVDIEFNLDEGQVNESGAVV